MTIRVLLVDDQPLLRTGFRLILEAEPDITVVGEAGDGKAAQDQSRALLPDVVLMDIRMPGVDGIEATRRIAREAAAGAHVPRVLVLTTFDLDEYIVEALRAGASGFLLKDVPPDELVQAIRVVAAGTPSSPRASPGGCWTGSAPACPRPARSPPRPAWTGSPSASWRCCG
nr:hypothetical protein GCM10020093_026740 [Planobispora longispora]